MIAWTLAFLAVASAAPQLQPLRTQILSSSQGQYVSGSQPLQGQIYTSSQPLQGQVYSSQPLQAQIYTNSQPIQSQILTSQQPQYVTGQIISSSQIPLAQGQYQQYSQAPLNVQTIQTVPQNINYQSVPLNIQSVPVNTVSSVNYQPIQNLRVTATPKPVVRTQTLRPIIATTASPLNIQTVQPIQYTAAPQVVAAPQIRTVQVQQQVPQGPLAIEILRRQGLSAQAPQVHTVVAAAPQVHTVVAAAPQVHTVQVQQRVAVPQGVAILRQVQDVQADGTYSFAFETENGIKAQEEGRSASNGAELINSVQGSYSYTAPDGTPITVNYVADENGFRAEGEHIPKPSEAILRSLEYLRSLPDRPEDQEGRYVRDENGY